MSKLHLALVGGQPAPVYNGILEDHPDQVIFICSDSTKQQVENISRVVGQQMSVSTHEVIIDPVNLENIHQHICNLAHQITDEDTVTINLSGGTKLWDILFYEQFYNKEYVNCIFIDQNNFVWDLKTRKSHQLKHRLSLDETFGLNGIKVRQQTNLKDYTQEDQKCEELIRKIRKAKTSEFNEITHNLSDNLSEYSSNDCIISWDKNRQSFSYRFPLKNHLLEGELKSPHIRKLLLNTGWFEYEVAHFMFQWKRAKQIWLNTELTQWDNEHTLNEIDIIVETGEKLLFVECKTQVYDATDVDKFNNAVKSYGGVASKRIFFTDVPMKPAAAKKCDQAGILYFSMMTLEGDEEKQKNFFKLLDQEMQEINK